ncbi:DUF3307 domain-containing protein [Candidatus Woesearchaeota archaeon]|nr:DUF3307 domain-containing protein [Candidatus Woesearchaeota archaeon]
MGIFTILLLAHFVSDWFFQPDKWRETKIKIPKLRLFHCVQYSILFVPVLYFFEINLLWIIWIFITHLLIDDYRFVNWWNKNIRKATKPLPQWYPAVQDQILHILALAVIAAFC